MLSFIKLPAQIISFLTLNISPREVALGVCLGMFLGFIPLNGVMALLLLLFFFIFKINRFTTIITLPLFKLFYLLGVSKVTEQIGGYLLIDSKGLEQFWSFLTRLPVLAYLDINNTLVAGGIALSLVLCLPVYFISKKIYVSVIEKYLIRLQSTKLAKRLTRFKIINNIILNMEKVRARTE